MKYLLDTNVLSTLYDLSSPQRPLIIEKLNRLTDSDGMIVSMLSLYEMEYAHANAPEQKQHIIRNDINHLKANFKIVPLSVASADCFGKLKKQFKDSRTINKENIKKHTLDIMLASCAITEDITLVSADKIFPALQQLNKKLEIEDWTR